MLYRDLLAPNNCQEFGNNNFVIFFSGFESFQPLFCRYMPVATIKRSCISGIAVGFKLVCKMSISSERTIKRQSFRTRLSKVATSGILHLFFSTTKMASASAMSGKIRMLLGSSKTALAALPSRTSPVRYQISG